MMNWSENNSKRKEISISSIIASNDNLRVLFNKHLVINVGKESAMKNSLYFQAMLSASSKQSSGGLLTMTLTMT